jgi:hypothetical protein
MQLTVDTSWWTRYRSRAQNPDIDSPSFQQAVLSLSQGQFPAIPRDDSDITIHKTGKHIQAIANTAAFHFAFIEVGGSSLYPTLALSVTHPEVLRILISIGPTETSHFQTWHDKAGNAVSDSAAHSWLLARETGVAAIRKHVDRSATIMTDEWTAKPEKG